MSNKIGRIHEKKGDSAHMGADITGRAAQYFVAALTVAICMIVPLYAKDGYNQIGNAKFEIYRVIMMAGCPIILVLATACTIFEIKATDTRTSAVPAG